MYCPAAVHETGVTPGSWHTKGHGRPAVVRRNGGVAPQNAPMRAPAHPLSLLTPLLLSGLLAACGGGGGGTGTGPDTGAGAGLGAAAGATAHDTIWQADRLVTTPVVMSARKAYEMAGYGPKDIQVAQFYD